MPKFLTYKLYCINEDAWKSVIKLDSDEAPTLCPTDSAHSIAPDSVSVSNIVDTTVQPVRQVLGEDDQSLSTRGFHFIAAAGVATAFDKQFDKKLNIRGGVIKTKNEAPGDWIEILIIDKDDVLGIPASLPEEAWATIGIKGYTPEGYPILRDYLKEWFILPGEVNEAVDVSIGKLPAPGIYGRIVYHSVGETDVDVVVNAISYEGDDA